ncbi:transcription antitermination factor NusB [Roseicyclus sp. F158]|uniref:Transcription antitermination factor NusB n=1 Tax=Tropicimonas omnivorans TaxID=3075590 RepID=A0ABU3DD35_9RHOB|nr:transcription antitermination factor NusB [Roseicyclus sp. F158]MDT0681072.1 transcription antitermination factor NusB [Roseicyclus sp. F158]
MSQSAKAVQDPRALALTLIAGVERDRRSLADLEAEAPYKDAPPEVRARAGRLARQTLRLSSRADAALGPFLARPPRPEIRDILRLAATELMVDGSAPHGVVSEAVTLAKRRQPRASGMVNAVLRKLAADGRQGWDKAPPKRLPGWLRGRLSAAYGNARVAKMEAIFEATPPVDVTPRGPDATLPEGEILPTGSLRLAAPGRISALPGYDDGAWWVQDAAAALPARLLDAQPGERVLDLCAAPGGKTLQLAATGASVTALDVSDQRLGRLRDNLARTGLAAEIVVADGAAWQPEDGFDAILLDAPCSATGTIRRHPDLPYIKSAAQVSELAALQTALLERAAEMLRPGGRLVVCTCSLLPQEGEDLAVPASLVPNPEAMDRVPGLEAAWTARPGALRITPESWAEKVGIDGFWIAAYRKPGGA